MNKLFEVLRCFDIYCTIQILDENDDELYCGDVADIPFLAIRNTELDFSDAGEPIAVSTMEKDGKQVPMFIVYVRERED